ncbi:MAG: transposase [Opitutaceae bacterium]
MPRTARLEYAGACYHVINRGNYRRNLFDGEGAAAAFERVLDEACGRFGWRVHAYVIMRNHYHLALETPEPNLSLGMKWLQGTWVARFNRLRRQTGRPFQGRFKALHVEPGHALAQVAHYIHLNPVRAHVTSADALATFRWSSLHFFPKKERPGWLEPGTVLAESGGLPDTKAGWARYLGYLALLAEEAPSERNRRFAKLSRGWCVGSDEFRAALRKDLATRSGLKPGRFAGLEPGEWRKEREADWEQKLQAAAAVMQTDLTKLPARKSALEKVRLAAILKRRSDVSNGWLAQRLGMGQPASVSQFTRRFRFAGGEETTAFRKALSRVKV